MSYPALTAFFCSSIFILSRSVILRLMVLMAALWSMDWMWSVTTRLLSSSRKSANIRSVSSGARICRKLTAPKVLPIKKLRPLLKVKLSGAMKSLLDSPVFQIASQAKRNLPVPAGWNIRWRMDSRSYPSRAWALTPSTLKLARMSASIRSRRGFAAFRSSASMPKVMYLVLLRPLLPLASWPFNISEYSRRMALKSSSCSGMWMVRLYSSISTRWFKKDSWK